MAQKKIQGEQISGNTLTDLNGDSISSGNIPAARLSGTYNIDVDTLGGQNSAYHLAFSNMTGSVAQGQLPARTLTVFDTAYPTIGPNLAINAWTTVTLPGFPPTDNFYVLLSGHILKANSSTSSALYVSDMNVVGRPTTPNVLAGTWPALAYLPRIGAGTDYFSGNSGTMWISPNASNQFQYYHQNATTIGTEAYLYVIGYII